MYAGDINENTFVVAFSPFLLVMVAFKLFPVVLALTLLLRVQGDCLRRRLAGIHTAKGCARSAVYSAFA